MMTLDALRDQRFDLEVGIMILTTGKPAGAFKNGRYLHCPNGSHLAIYDDQHVYVSGLIRFIKDVETGRFP